MTLTPCHADYFANELNRRYPSDSVEKLAGALADPQVDLNPHQVDAALFAFNSPLSGDAVLHLLETGVTPPQRVDFDCVRISLVFTSDVLGDA